MIIKSAADIAKKWLRITSGRTEDYELGVRDPQKDWAKETSDAEDRYEEGVKKAILRKAFSKGVNKVGTAKQQLKSITKGIPRFAEGVMGAENDMKEGMEPVVAVLSALKLPQRYPSGDPRNLERVKAIQQALHNWKIGK